MKSIFYEIYNLEYSDKRAALCIVVSTSGSVPRKAGAKMIVLEDGTIKGTIGGGCIEKEVIAEALRVIQNSTPTFKDYCLKDDADMHCGGSVQVFIEPVSQQQKLLVFGAGHISRTLCRFAAELGFSITVVDERNGIFQDNSFDNCNKINADYREAIDNYEFDNNTFIVIVTHKHIHDENILKLLCKKKHRYLGMIGSKTKVAEIRKRFISEKIMTEEEFDAVDSPIGIKIAANLPQEIAVCILAKMIDVRNTHKN